MFRKMLFFVFVILAAAPGVFALSPIGAPVAGLSKGQMRVSVDYGYMDADIDTDGVNAEIDGFQSNTVLANLGYGLFENVEIYGLIGGSDGEAYEFNSSFEPAFGFGVKATFAEDVVSAWGVAYQMLWINPEDKVRGVNVDVDAYEFKLAMGPSYKMEGFQLYGGPFLYYIDGDIDANGVVGGFPATANVDINQNIQLGGYFGVSIDLSPCAALMTEYQQTHDVAIFGTSLCFKF